MYSPEILETALKYEVVTFANSVFINDSGIFLQRPLPHYAQTSSVNAIAIDDFNNDGNFDVYVHDGDTSGAPDEVTSTININERPLTEGNSGNLLLFEGGSFDETRDYYYPIPMEDLELNDNLEQNPGW